MRGKLDDFRESESQSRGLLCCPFTLSRCNIINLVVRKLATSKTVRKGRLVEAFGELKSIPEWADDARCTVSIVHLRERLASGMTAEEAISTESRHDQRLRNGSAIYTAFGASKPIRMWLADPRCVVTTRELNLRLKSGVPFVQALTDPLPIKNNRPIEAFGDMKSIRQWSEDPRCEVGFDKLSQRLRHGFTLEDAMRQECRKDPLVRHEAFGESKTLGEWVGDPRCQVKETELRRRVAKGLPLEEAMTRRRTLAMIEAFGESKPIGAWSRDRRCLVSEPTLTERLALGFPPERALTDPPGTKLDGTRFGPHRVKIVHAFGESKSVADWARDERASVSREAISFRLRMGWSPELAITLGSRDVVIARDRAPHQIEAFGEVKSLYAWAKDSRAQVSKRAIRERLKRGYSPEQAISEPNERIRVRPFWEIEPGEIPPELAEKDIRIRQ